MKDLIKGGALIVGCLLAIALVVGAVVAFYGAIIGGLLGAAYLVLKAIVGLAS